jgi:DNA polymerase-3 subunit delta'
VSVWDALEGFPSARALERQVASGASPHAWLLLGPAGAGKGAAAEAIAAALNCPVEPGRGCGKCSSCRRVARRAHPDVHHHAPEGPLIPVDVVRDQIAPEAARSPFEGAFKVFILEAAERMNDAAQNALLKTIEEPQPDTVFVLVSDNEEELLETVRSRCRVVRLEPLTLARVRDVVTGEGAAPEVADAAARASSGDLTLARALALDGPTRARRSLWASLPGRLTSAASALDAAADVLQEARAAVRARDQEQRAEVLELSDALGEGRGTAAARNALGRRHRRELKRLEEDVLGEALSYLASFYRDVVAWRAGDHGSIVNSDAPELEAWASSGGTDAAMLGASERCLVARASFESNANATLAMEAVLVELSRLVPPPRPRADRVDTPVVMVRPL